VIFLFAFLLSCRPKNEDLPSYTILFGGDFIMGRRINEALYDPEKSQTILGDVDNIFLSADLGIINAEGVIAHGGFFSDKGEPRPHMYRAHPNVLDVLKKLEIDALTVANNHSGDYGSEAFAEMLYHIHKADMQYIGGGSNISEAMQATYFTLPNATIAIIGADLTIGKYFAASDNKPGIWHLPGLKKKQRKNVIEQLINAGETARKHADIVLFSPHWGDNMKDAPSPNTRKIANALLNGPYDAIIGHSAHWIQGMEVINNKPVVYDMGNLVVDYAGRDDGHYGMLIAIEVNKNQVLSLTGHPLRLKKNKTTLDSSGVALNKFIERSKQLGTTMQVIEGNATYELPYRDGIHQITPPPKKGVPPAIQSHSESTSLVNESPLWSSNGIELLQAKMALTDLSVPKAGNIMELWLKAGNNAPETLIIHERSTWSNGKETKSNYDRHFPGDWLRPIDTWRPNEVIHDSSLIRHRFTPEGVIDYSICFSESTSYKDCKEWYPVGSATYNPDAKKLFLQLKEREQ